MEIERTMIEIDENNAIGFIKHGNKYFEYIPQFFSIDFPDITQEEIKEIELWADQNASMFHINELEYEFPIPYWDNKYLQESNTPKTIIPIFKALMKYGKNLNKDLQDHEKVIPCLKLWLPDEL